MTMAAIMLAEMEVHPELPDRTFLPLKEMLKKHT